MPSFGFFVFHLISFTVSFYDHLDSAKISYENCVTYIASLSILVWSRRNGQVYLNQRIFLVLVAAVKDLARDHVTEKVAIHRPDLIITDARPPSPTGHADHPHPMGPRAGRIALKNEDVVYLLEAAGKKVTARALQETKAGMAWGVSQRMVGVGTPRHSITAADPWRVDEETHPLRDSTWSVAEVHLEGGEAEVGRTLFVRDSF